MLGSFRRRKQRSRRKLPRPRPSLSVLSAALAKLPVSDDEDTSPELKQVKDEEMRSEATQKIAEGLTQVVHSLQELTDHAEAEERKAKRLRKSGEESGGEGLPPTPVSSLPSMQPFGTPGAM